MTRLFVYEGGAMTLHMRVCVCVSVRESVCVCLYESA
jgi:hypothetical protein